ncbi:hypothetical protein RMATCC62417_13950 [Rhizopus microsporus]|nr:hypothetical protein RMATCC62417_13950 [Rhizopus microsporus]
MLSFQAEFRIILDTKHIILHGTADESAGVCLRGAVFLKCQEPIKVKMVTLSFQGIAQVHWTEAQESRVQQYKDERILFEKKWVFLKPQRKAYTFDRGEYKWEFELALPGHLPESIEHELGRVNYTFKACCERPAFSSNFWDKQTVQVSRLLYYAHDSSIIISSVWSDKVIYDISIPKKTYTSNTMIPITFHLEPLAEDLSIHMVSCKLKEYVTYCVPGHKKSLARTIHIRRDEHTKGRWSLTELVHVPINVHVDTQGELIQVKHKLKFVVSLKNSDGHMSELRASIPVVVTSVSADENELPPYNESCKSTIIDAELPPYDYQLPTYESIIA